MDLQVEFVHRPFQLWVARRLSHHLKHDPVIALIAPQDVVIDLLCVRSYVLPIDEKSRVFFVTFLYVAFADCDEEVFFALEVQVERTLAEPKSLCDVLHLCSVISRLRKTLDGRLDYLFLELFLVRICYLWHIMTPSSLE